MNDFGQFKGTKTPLLMVGSPQNQAVSGLKNELLLVTLARKVGAKTQVIGVIGPHLNRQYVNADVGRQIGLFYRTHR